MCTVSHTQHRYSFDKYYITSKTNQTMLYSFNFILWDLTNLSLIPLKLFLNYDILNHDKGIAIFYPTEQVSAH